MHRIMLQTVVVLKPSQIANEGQVAKAVPVPNLYARTLKRAAQVVGGSEQLAVRLQVRDSHLALWLAGVEKVPGEVFLKAVDVLTDSNGQNKPPS
jgi:hypothetical protein